MCQGAKSHFWPSIAAQRSQLPQWEVRSNTSPFLLALTLKLAMGDGPTRMWRFSHPVTRLLEAMGRTGANGPIFFQTCSVTAVWRTRNRSAPRAQFSVLCRHSGPNRRSETGTSNAVTDCARYRVDRPQHTDKALLTRVRGRDPPDDLRQVEVLRCRPHTDA